MQCPSPIYISRHRVTVPCGKCGACMARKISDYTVRLSVEHRFSNKCFFVTLTYEKDPLQLYKSDLQCYFKRLRKVGAQFSYFALGDYGDTFGRPHYHVIFFSKGYFPAEYLHSLWVSGDQTRRRGFINCRPLTGGRIAYVVRYGFLAKLDWDKSDGRQKPFFLMSRRPALGSQYCTGNGARFHRQGDIWYFPDGKFKKPLPRYYRDKLFTKPGREAHADDVKNGASLRMEVELNRLRTINGDRALEMYYVAQHEQADKFLENLRNQKRLKNKLL